ncbi:MAG TPA: hypothetical protein VGG69_02115 [Rhizomicrobium sp.]|jgi:hypothetical protein
MHASRHAIILLAASVATLILAPTALADANSEVVTAATHASLAAGSADITGVHTHLHHALNCLVGPKGNGFDAKELNPCAQSGKGAIPDTSDPTKKAALESTAAKARSGIAANDYKASQKDAADLASMLKQAK